MNTNAPLIESSALPTLSAEDYIAMLRRRWRVVAALTVVAILIAGVIALKTKPVYEASGELLVEAQSSSTTIDATDPIASLMANSVPQTVETQVAMLQNASLIDEVASQVGAPAADIGKRLSVVNVDQTNIIAVTEDLNSPQAAADSVNYLLKDYLQQQQNVDQSNVEKAYSYMQAQKDTSWAQLLAAQGALQSYEQSHNIADVDRNRDNVLENVSTLTANYEQETSSVAGLQSRIAVEQKLLAQQPEALMTTVRTTNTEVQADRDQINRLLEQKANLTQPGGFTEHAPAVQAIDGQIAQLRRELAAEPVLTATVTGTPNSVREDLVNRLTQDQSDLATHEANIATLQTQLATAQSSERAYPGYAVTVARLTGNIQTAQNNYDLYNAKAASLNIRRQTYHPHATISQLAETPSKPVQPKKAQIVGFGLGIGVFLGLLAALLLEFVDDKIYERDDITRSLHLPVFGSVPALLGSAEAKNQMVPAAMQSFRALRDSLLLATNHHSLKTLVVTSAQKGEGVSTVAVNLAYALAEANVKTILIDTNLREPALHTIFETPAVPGLTEVLNGSAQLFDVLLDNERLPDLMTIASGARPGDPTRVLQSKRFAALQKELAAVADIVIYDAPAVDEGADAQILASHADGVLLVVGVRKTQKKHILATIERLQSTTARIIGVCANAPLGDTTGPQLFATPQILSRSSEEPMIAQLNGGSLRMRPASLPTSDSLSNSDAPLEPVSQGPAVAVPIESHE